MNTDLLDSDSDDEVPPGWEERAGINGEIFYVNHVEKRTQWNHPRTGKAKTYQNVLPFGWERIVDEDGKVIYYDKIREITSLIDPRLVLTVEEKSNLHDIRYKYDGHTTALEILHGTNLSEYVAIVTGANSGIGYEVARCLSLHGCEVIFACRSFEKAERSVTKVKSQNAFAKCIPMILDLSSLKSIKLFASHFKLKYRQLNILILNAAVFWLPFMLTEDNFESTFQICHLGHFYLTTLLEDRMVNQNFSRIVVVSCESHRFSNLTNENLRETVLGANRKRHWKILAYVNAKLCNMLFANELHNRLYSKGVQVFAVHPGNMVYSNIIRHCWWPIRLLYNFCRPFTKSLEQAAGTVIFCAVSYLLNDVSGIYFNNCFPCPPSEISKDNELAKQLWQLSEYMIRQVVSDKSLLQQ